MNRIPGSKSDQSSLLKAYMVFPNLKQNNVSLISVSLATRTATVNGMSILLIT